MNHLHLEGGIPLSLNNAPTFSSVAFDGAHYYFTNCCGNSVVKTDCSFQTECCIETQRSYCALVFDPSECCFWAASNHCYGKIYKLNRCLSEIDCLTFGCYCGGPITSLSYDCCKNEIVVASTNDVVSVNKKTGKNRLIYSECRQIITGVLSLCNGYLLTIIGDNKQRLVFINEECEANHIGTFENMVLKAMLCNPCVKKCQPVIELFVLKDGCVCAPYVYRVKCHALGIECPPCDCCDCCDCCHCCDCCDPLCNECCEPHHPHLEGCNDVLESIALMETALSHILNAEGEKLQKVLAESDDIDTILCVNREIRQTIINVTHLEQVLYEKLCALQDICHAEPPCPDDNHKCCDCGLTCCHNCCEE